VLPKLLWLRFDSKSVAVSDEFCCWLLN